MGGGGGKGGSQTQQVQIPSWVSEPASRNLARAEAAQKIGYMPYYGADVAAFNPTQQAAMQNTLDAASAFGMATPTPNQAGLGMPTPTIFADGTVGYSSGSLYDQAVAEFERKRPGQAAAYNELFVNPFSANTKQTTAAAPVVSGGPIQYPVGYEGRPRSEWYQDGYGPGSGPGSISNWLGY